MNEKTKEDKDKLYENSKMAIKIFGKKEDKAILELIKETKEKE